MSTNYYVGKTDGLHIGKSSGGWDFLWRGHEHLGLMTRENWETYLDGATIVAEHGLTYTIGEFIAGIVDDHRNVTIAHAAYWLRYERNGWENSHLREVWVDNKGNPFCGAEFS